ncbi:O-methyltransferase [Arcticibacter svalbardensis MN12-7]|uniref:O-methyltransferase n=1 Tax=Arcticibacter svalbardensis MN12-7 TaxID=1150600 RepID=R9H0U5_9SPHI|nr:O-methyltransferase [Arcticibacter svalbardensis]EOR94854.1 O-methyltransferase [Arcticibacter svalbardensis MN12-7]
MELLTDDVQIYLEQHCEEESELLRYISRETHLKVPMARMLSGHYQGRVLSFLSKIQHPDRILEIGTYTGYATLCLAEGLREDGLLHTIDVNEELEERVREYFNSSQLSNKIVYHIGQAVDVIPTLTDSFDLVFIDADKKNNGTYYDMVFDKVTKGGLIIVDNVLWHGKIAMGAKDKDTQNISTFNDKVTNDHRVEKLILPVRDGLLIIRKL